ncbi:segment polarity protein dishevelled [Mytilus galloprovincialis]|uniref:Segment polarity protein dishevelled n=1 Tax=Mytilus galloprovincialis TaxID=29158 RepID=A0A8B6C6M8_MYTGA|nr:segment polarity protein dishevelled [Mytilus galloprovincialis]
MEETKIIYYIDDEDTPYLIKLPIPADRVNLGDFKNALNRPNYKFFFKSVDDDFGVVKEEIVDDEAKLPCFNGRVVSWLVPAESSTSDSQSQCTDSQAGDVHPPTERVGGIGDSRPPSFHANASSVASRDQSCDTCTETDSVISSRRDRPRCSRQHSYNHNFRRPGDPIGPPRTNGHSKHHGHSYDSSTVLSSDIDTTSFFDTDDDSRFSTVTDTTNRTASKYGRQKRRQRRKHRMPPISRASSFSSITDSTMSLNVIVVTLNMDTVNFLGISIVGQSNKGGDGGIYVGSIMKGGAVAQDGRIEPGDMILEVNGISFENLSNDDAVRVLREAVQKPGLKYTQCISENLQDPFTISFFFTLKASLPLDWEKFSNYINPFPLCGCKCCLVVALACSFSKSTRVSLTCKRYSSLFNTDVRIKTIHKIMLKYKIRLLTNLNVLHSIIINSRSDLVDWLFTHLEGFTDRRDARKYACNLLKAGYIRHTVNKITFSEQCYYVFGDIYGNLSALSLEDVDSVSEADRDTLAPLPPPAWNNQYPYTNNTYIPQNISYIPPYSYTSTDSQSYIGSFVDGMDKNSTVGAGGVIGVSSIGNGGGNNSGGSVHSASGSSASGSSSRKEKSQKRSPANSGSDSETASIVSARQPGGPPHSNLVNLPPDVSGSRQSFRMAMGNPCEFFVDVM